MAGVWQSEKTQHSIAVAAHRVLLRRRSRRTNFRYQGSAWSIPYDKGRTLSAAEWQSLSANKQSGPSSNRAELAQAGALEVLKHLRASGYTAYFVGGCV